MISNLKKFPVYAIRFKDWDSSLTKLLDAANLASLFEPYQKILLKPNLVEASDPPITTPVKLVASLIEYIRRRSPNIEIVVGEGTGAMEYDTWVPFRKLGYMDMASEKKVQLIDLNEAPLIKLSDNRYTRWPKLYVPEVIMESFLISIPVLKAHSFSQVTLTMKNMIGVMPPKYYNAGSWKKSAFHDRIHEAVFDLNRYRKPDFSILDATIGMQEAHLWGATCNPRPNLLAACRDPVAIDAFGAELLKCDWKTIGHIKMAHGVLGFAEPKKVIRL